MQHFRQYTISIYLHSLYDTHRTMLNSECFYVCDKFNCNYDTLINTIHKDSYDFYDIDCNRMFIYIYTPTKDYFQINPNNLRREI